jgi:hypothetical protein
MGHCSIGIVVGTTLLPVALIAAGPALLALALWAKCRRPRVRGAYHLAGIWEGSLVEVGPNRLPVVSYLRLTLSLDGKYQNEVRAFQGATPVGKPVTFTGTYTFEPGEGEEGGELEIVVLQPRPCCRQAAVTWVSRDRFVYTSNGVKVVYHRDS